MSYEKHDFQSGEKLYASQLNEMDDAIFKIDSKIDGKADLLNENCMFSNGKHNNLNFDWIENCKCHIYGLNVVSGGWNVIVESQTSMPKWLKVDKTYYVNVDSNNNRICLQFFFYSNGVEGETYRFYKNGIITIPKDVNGIAIRIRVEDAEVGENIDSILTCSMIPNFTSGLLGEIDELKTIISGKGDELLNIYGSASDNVNNGVTFHWINNNICEMTGIATAAATSTIKWTPYNMPDWLEKGKRYSIKINNTQKGIASFQILLLNGSSEQLYRFYEDGEFTIPEYATGIVFRIKTYHTGKYPVQINNIITIGFYEPSTGLAVQIDDLKEKDEKRKTDIENINTILNTNDNYVMDFVNTECISQISNFGKEISIMTYNVQNYDADNGTFISDEKLTNLKKFLSSVKADVICTQEDRLYIDSEKTKSSHNYIYKPVYPVSIGTNNRIFTKYNTIEQNIVAFPNYTGRSFSYCVLTIDTKKILIISTHLPYEITNEGINARKTIYSDILAWVHGEKDISGRHKPDWDYCIICGDFNGSLDEDKANISELTKSRGFSMANGGWIGWLRTTVWNASVDHIICSPNIIINSINVYESWKELLYSDHYPMVCNLTLCE